MILEEEIEVKVGEWQKPVVMEVEQMETELEVLEMKTKLDVLMEILSEFVKI